MFIKHYVLLSSNMPLLGCTLFLQVASTSIFDCIAYNTQSISKEVGDDPYSDHYILYNLIEYYKVLYLNDLILIFLILLRHLLYQLNFCKYFHSQVDALFQYQFVISLSLRCQLHMCR